MGIEILSYSSEVTGSYSADGEIGVRLGGDWGEIGGITLVVEFSCLPSAPGPGRKALSEVLTKKAKFFWPILPW